MLTGSPYASSRSQPASSANGSFAPASPRGVIEVSPRAIAALAGHAIVQCYGVIGITTRRPRLGALPLLPPEQYSRGIAVRFIHDHIAIDVYVVLEHGLRISEIAHNLIKDVKYEVEQALGMPVVEVNVTVQALRVNEPVS
jgi:uncharacterized alkaline shock family protein YloU